MKQNKTVKVLSTAALAATLLVPVAAPAFAASTYSVTSSVQQTSKGSLVKDVRVSVEVTPGSLTTNDTLRLRLPADSYGKLKATPYTIPALSTGTNQFAAVGTVTLTPVASSGNATTGYNEFELQVNVTSPSASSDKGLLYIDFDQISVPSSLNDKLDVTFEAKDGSAFSNGAVTVAKVSSGAIKTTIDDVKALQPGKNQPIAPIRFQEDVAGTLQNGDTFTIKLPKGFTWNNKGTVNVVWGDGTANFSSTLDTDNRKLILTYNGPTTTKATYWTISGLTVDVDDDVAKAGDVEVTLDGTTTVSNSTLLVARYGTYGNGMTASDAPNVTAGRDGEEIGKFTITENAPGSLIAGRTIKLTLSGNAKWSQAPKIDAAASDLQGLSLGAFSINPNDPSTVTATVNTQSSGKAAKIVLKDGEIDLAADASAQDITVTAGGTATATGNAVVAKVVSPISAKIDGETKKAIIGSQAQEVAPIIITEVMKGALDDKKTSAGNNLVLQFPKGVTPNKNGVKVEVTDGDITLDTQNIAVNTSNDTIVIPVKYASTKPSTIKVSGVKVDVDRTVAEGPLEVEVGGSALVKTATQFPNSTYVSKVAVANIITPAPSDTTASNIVFKLNSKTYTVDGKELTMDAAPLVGWDRAYLPVRFAANALNVSDDQIVWDDKTNTFTVFKGDRVVTGKVGDKFLTVNGVKVPMDVPVWRNKEKTNNRVMVPIRYLANALNANIDWNKETGEITIQVK